MEDGGSQIIHLRQALPGRRRCYPKPHCQASGINLVRRHHRAPRCHMGLSRERRLQRPAVEKDITEALCARRGSCCVDSPRRTSLCPDRATRDCPRPAVRYTFPAGSGHIAAEPLPKRNSRDLAATWLIGRTAEFFARTGARDMRARCPRPHCPHSAPRAQCHPLRTAVLRRRRRPSGFAAPHPARLLPRLSRPSSSAYPDGQGTTISDAALSVQLASAGCQRRADPQ